MTSTMRQSRLGLDVSGIPRGQLGGQAARLILDFFGGTPGFVTGTVMGLPRLLYAFGRLERAGTAIQVGQDHVLLAPRDPTSLAAFAFPQFFRSGNLYLRAPQVRVEQTLGGFTVKAGHRRAGGRRRRPATYVFAPAAGAGERVERPAVEGHVGFDRGDADAGAEAHAGVSGHYGWIKQARRLVRRRRAAPSTSWPAARDAWAWLASCSPPRTSMPTAPGVAQPGASEGGWVEARLAASSRVSMQRRRCRSTAGPTALAPAGRLRNTSCFGNMIVRLTPEVAGSLEYKWLQTRYGSGRNRENHHVNAVFAVTF